MAETAFTPGPWRVAHGNAYNSSLYVMAGEAAEICEVFDDSEEMAPPDEANARLIAQAPAMLEALREAEDHMILMYSGIAGGDAGAGQRFADKDPVVAIVRKVIAAATGEAP